MCRFADMSMSGSPCVLSVTAARADTYFHTSSHPSLTATPRHSRHNDTTNHTPLNLSIKRMSHLQLHTTAISKKGNFNLFFGAILRHYMRRWQTWNICDICIFFFLLETLRILTEQRIATHWAWSSIRVITVQGWQSNAKLEKRTMHMLPPYCRNSSLKMSQNTVKFLYI